jgi:hypothetical protein
VGAAGGDDASSAWVRRVLSTPSIADGQATPRGDALKSYCTSISITMHTQSCAEGLLETALWAASRVLAK